MIYNLVGYVQSQLATIVIVANGWEPNSPKDSVTISQSGGEVKHYYNRKDFIVQVLSRAKSSIVAKTQIEAVFDLLLNKFGLVLPQVTVGSTVHSAVTTYQISPVELPGYIGADRANLEMWSLNFIITTE